MKICNICNTDKENNCFSPRTSSKDGLSSYCKDCQKQSQLQFSIDNPLMICNLCKEEKSIDQFPKLNNSLQGYAMKCRSCTNERQRNYWLNDKELFNSKRSINNITEEKKLLRKQQKRNDRIKNVTSTLLRNARTRAKEKNLEFNITKNDIIIPEFCPLLNVKLEVGTKGNYNFSPSLDRIDSSKGYTKDNIQVISMLANTMKNKATKEQLITFSTNILKFYDIV